MQLGQQLTAQTDRLGNNMPFSHNASIKKSHVQRAVNQPWPCAAIASQKKILSRRGKIDLGVS